MIDEPKVDPDEIRGLYRSISQARFQFDECRVAIEQRDSDLRHRLDAIEKMLRLIEERIDHLVWVAQH